MKHVGASSMDLQDAVLVAEKMLAIHGENTAEKMESWAALCAAAGEQETARFWRQVALAAKKLQALTRSARID
jgi:hypothetical protein